MLGFIGGTGPEGRGMALRFALAGEKCFIGSRNQERGQQIAEELGTLVPSVASNIGGGDNQECSEKGDIVLITTPFDGQRDTLQALKKELAGKIVVNVIAPMVFERGKGAMAVNVAEGSAALQAKAILPNSTIVGAFQNLSAEDLLIPDKNVDCDVVVCADDQDAKTTIMELAEKIKNIRAVNGGGLMNARYIENLTTLLVNINRIYKVHSSIKITGLEGH